MIKPRIKKKGQVEVTFNWIYVLIAGAVILLFFVGIVVKQKAFSEENLAGDLVQTMGSIFNAAGAAEKTKNIIDISGLADYTLYFGCENGLGKFGVKDRSASIDNPIDPVFAPAEIQSTRLITWSLPYKLPYKVIDFLLVTSENTKYYLIGNDYEFVQEFMNSTNEFNREYLGNVDKAEVGGNYQVRLIDTDGLTIKKNGLVSEKLQLLDDDKVTAVSFVTESSVDYYQKSGDYWEKKNVKPVEIISLGGEKDAAKYAAIFASDDQNYQCNMKKAFLRLKYVTEVYLGKYQENAEYHQNLGKKDFCYSSYVENGEVLSVLETHKNLVDACTLKFELCPDLITSASNLAKINEDLETNNCLVLY